MLGVVKGFVFSILVAVCRCQAPCSYSQYLQPGGQEFLINSPGYPVDRYRPASTCVWRAFTNQGAIISLECPYVEIPQSGAGCLDQLIVSDTENPQDGLVYCGRTKIYHDSSGNLMTIQIISAYNSPGGRFSCKVKAHHALVPVRPNCVCGYSYRSRIVGGTDTGINEFPFMAALISQSIRDILCGATIVTERFSVTAAHCVKGRDVTDLGILVGDHDITTGRETNASMVVKVINYWYHPQFDATKLINDISVVEINKRLLFTARVGPACLPFNHPQTHNGESVQALGWGSTEFGGIKAEKLQKVTLSVSPINKCQELYKEKVNIYGQLCTIGDRRDACQHDSGGPIIWIDPHYSRYMLIGVISYGRGCGLNLESVNTRVYAYLGWIESIISSDFYCVV